MAVQYAFGFLRQLPTSIFLVSKDTMNREGLKGFRYGAHKKELILVIRQGFGKVMNQAVHAHSLAFQASCLPLIWWKVPGALTQLTF